MKMLRLASDADVNGHIVDGLRHRLGQYEGSDFVRVQDALAERTPDPDVLEWAARENRILITHDRNTMLGFVKARVKAKEPVPGIILTSKTQSFGDAIEQILMIAACVSEDEIRDQVVIYLPLR
jgi:predicted nuclease of predicted toxin-antitoxin system